MLAQRTSHLLSALVLFLSVGLTVAIPWDINSRSSMGSTTGGVMTYIEAMGRHDLGEMGFSRHLMGLPQGQPGNVTIRANEKSPALWFVRKNQLYQYVNDTTIYPVNVHNVTINRVPPLQLVLGKKPDGLQGGTWRFSGSMLYYDFPGRDDDLMRTSNNPEYLKYFRSQGLFYTCAFPNGEQGIFMFYYLQDAGVDCFPFTLHSFMQEKKEKKEKKQQ